MSNVRKTKAMRDIESQFGDSLESLIVNAVRDNPRDQEAAASLGILPTTLSHWISRLHIEEQCEEARNLRLQSQVA